MWVAALVVQVLPSSPCMAQCNDSLPPLVSDTAIGANSRVLAAVSYTSPQGGGTPWTVVAGEFAQIGGRDIQYLAAWDGVTWRDLGATRSISAINGQVRALAIYNGRLIAAGFFSTAGATSVNNIAQWNGFTWEAMGSGISNPANPSALRINDLQVFGGELVVGGRFGVAGGLSVNNIAKWNGAAWSELSSGLRDNIGCSCAEVHALEVFNGQLVAGGDFDLAGSVAAHNIARWTGSVWLPLGGGFGVGDSAVFAMCLQDTRLYVGGRSGTMASRVMRWDGTSWGILSSQTTFSEINDTVRALAPHLGGVLIGGDFTPHYVANWRDGEFRGDVPLNLNGAIDCLAVAGGPIIMGGRFTRFDFNTTLNHVAYINGSSTFAFHETPPNVFAMTTFNGRVYAGGTFMVPGDGGAGPGGIDIRNIGRWDGTTLTRLSTGINGPVSALKGFNSGSLPFQSRNIVAGGMFTNAGGVAVSNIAAWIEGPTALPPPQWNAMGAGLNGAVNAIERFNNSTYAAGTFTQSGANRIARFDGTNWVAVGTGFNGTVYALKVYNTQLYAGGSFTTAGGIATGGLARWNGTAWSMVGGNFAGTVYALEVFNGELVIGGEYPGITGSPNIAKYNGASYSTLGSGGTDAAVRSLAVNGTKLYIGGNFAFAGGRSAPYLASWSSTAGWRSERLVADLGSVHALASIQSEVHAGSAYDGSFRRPPWNRYTTNGVPWFVQQPLQDRACRHADASFSVATAVGYAFFSLHWRHDGQPLAVGPTGTGSTVTAAGLVLNIINVGSADAGTYTCTVANSCGSATSNPATLIVCTADFNCDGSVDPDDLADFITCFFLDVQFPGTCPEADFNGDGFRDPDDLSDFITAFFTSTC